MVAEDPNTWNPDAMPTFNGFSANGNVTAELVYVNYGNEEDYSKLAKLVSVWLNGNGQRTAR